MIPRFPRPHLFVPVLAALAFAIVGCDRQVEVPPAEAPQSSTNGEPPPAPPAVPAPDTSTPTIERAAPPTLRAVALGKFEPGNPVAEAATGAIDIEDGKITGANGAGFVTERVAIVRGGDEFTAGQRYADIMMMDAEQPVELRRVVEETRPTAQPDYGFCSRMKTSYLAIASYDEDGNTLVKIVALQGDGLPAATAQDTTLCASTFYLAKR